MTLVQQSARELAAGVLAGRFTAREVVAAHLAQLHARNAELNAVFEERPELIEEDLAALDARLRAGQALPLAGVPLVVKDVIWVKDRRVTQGSRLFAQFIAPQDAIAVARLRAAGAIVIGMGNSSEFACKGLTTNKVYGLTTHPMDPSLTPGGSSGGCAAALAAHIAPIALGTDAGGSSRRPPSHVGAVGFKPSFGVIPDGPGFANTVEGIQVIAPMARNVGDARRMFDVLADADRLERPSLAPLRIAYSPSLGLDVPVDDDVRDAVEESVEVLRARGLVIERANPAWPAIATEEALLRLQHAGLARLYGQAWGEAPAAFDPDIARQIESGLQWSDAEMARSREASRQIAAILGEFFSRYDLLLCPTTPCVAWPNDRLGPSRIGGIAVAARAHAVFTPFFNHAGVPAISIPCGHGRDGLPVGLQIAGPRGFDHRVLDFAHVAEQAMAHLVSGRN